MLGTYKRFHMRMEHAAMARKDNKLAIVEKGNINTGRKIEIKQNKMWMLLISKEDIEFNTKIVGPYNQKS